jgi:hypothetical protein
MGPRAVGKNSKIFDKPVQQVDHPPSGSGDMACMTSDWRRRVDSGASIILVKLSLEFAYRDAF